MANLLTHADQVLRGGSEVAEPDRPARTLRRMVAYTLLGGMLYGGVMGTFGGLGGDRIWQIVYSAVKVPMLLMATFAISVPSFFVLNSLFGVRSDFGAVLRALLGAQAGLTIVLVAFAPYVALWYISFTDYSSAVLFNALLFGTASVAAQGLLRRAYMPLVARNGRHRLLRRSWIVLYAFVGIQMGWVLRPFVGAPGMPVEFFREETWGNAYVVVARMVWRVFGG